MTENGEQLNPKAKAMQMAMLKLLSQPPEQILSLFERLEIPWERTNIDEDSCLVILWSDLMEGERRNQQEGPFIRKLVEELKSEFAEEVPDFYKPPAPPKRKPAHRTGRKTTSE